MSCSRLSFMGLYDCPELVHSLLELVVETYILLPENMLPEGTRRGATLIRFNGVPGSTDRRW